MDVKSCNEYQKQEVQVPHWSACTVFAITVISKWDIVQNQTRI